MADKSKGPVPYNPATGPKPLQSNDQRSELQKFIDWWNEKPSKPVEYKVTNKQGVRVPVRNQPANRYTLQRYAPAPYLSLPEGAANLLQNVRPLEFTRDLVKGVYGLGKSVVTDPLGSAEKLGRAGGIVEGILAARKAEQTGKWENPEPGSIYSLMTPTQLANWRREGTQNYRKLASHYSYIQDGKRVFDSAALMRNLTQRPMEVLSVIFPATEVAGARLAEIPGLKTVGNVVETGSKIGNVVTNPAPYLIANTVRAASPIVNAGLRAAGVRPTIFAASGGYTDKMLKAFRDADIDPALFNTPETRTILENVINEKGISPAAIKEAVLTTVPGLKASRSMTTGEASLAPEQEKAFRAAANQILAQNMQQNVQAAYGQAASHRGVFTNTGDFASGVRQSIEDELATMGYNIDDVLQQSRFKASQEIINGTKNTPGIFQRFEDLSGSKSVPPLTAQDLSGATHTFDYGKNQWLDASGTPVTAPAKVQYLDAVSNRPNLPPPTGGQNRLTPFQIDSVRRDVTDIYPKASGDDQAILAAINRGIDNYVIKNASNFVGGDAAAMARDWTNARKTAQLSMRYGKAPEPDPFAPASQPPAYDPSAVARTEAARDIVQAQPDLANSMPPTIWQRIKGYIPSVGTGQLIGYNYGQFLGDVTGIPGAGLIVGSVTGAATKAARNKLEDLAAKRIFGSESAGAPVSPLFTPPNVRVPASIAGGLSTAAQSDYQTPVTLPTAPKPAEAPRSTLLPGEVSYEQYQKQFGQPAQEETKLPGEVSYDEYQKQFGQQPQAAGGRIGYKSGGRVGDIEPLVRALMAKAKMAKKASNKATEPLLNERDDAIANALAVAQKAI